MAIAHPKMTYEEKAGFFPCPQQCLHWPSLIVLGCIRKPCCSCFKIGRKTKQKRSRHHARPLQTSHFHTCLYRSFNLIIQVFNLRGEFFLLHNLDCIPAFFFWDLDFCLPIHLKNVWKVFKNQMCICSYWNAGTCRRPRGRWGCQIPRAWSDSWFEKPVMSPGLL